MDSTSENATDKPSTPKKRRLNRRELPKAELPKHRQQKYTKKWEEESDFKKWITPDTDDSLKAKCKFCNISMTAERSVLKSHMKSKRHETKMLGLRKNSVLTDTFLKTANANESTMVRKAELKLSAYFAEHNIAFNAAEHLGPVLKECFPDSKICKEITVNRKKTTNIITKVIGPNIKEELANKLRHKKFSILTDESTEISSTKTSCIMVRYYDDENRRIQSSFWKLHQVFCTGSINVNEGATASNLYKGLKASMSEFNIPDDNIVGFGSDGCNVMMGAHNSVASRFKENCPGIVIMKCICHSAHLCASEACKSLPSRCEELARAVYNFLKGSSKRSAQLVQFQEFFNLKPHKMLHPSQTRWLSLTAVVNRMLEQWPALTLYFTDMSLSEKIVTGQLVLEWLRDPFIKLFYYFLQWVLPKFTNLNTYFQSSRVVITELKAKIEELYRDLLLCFMDNNYVMQTEIQNVNPGAYDKHLGDAQMYLGVGVMNQMNEVDIRNNPTLLKDFYQRCRRFFEVGAKEIQKRWDFGDPVMAEIAALNPKIALSSTARVKTPSIVPLIRTLPRISSDDVHWQQYLDDQWRKLPLVNFPADISEEKESDVFWGKLLTWENPSEENEFSALAQFALDALFIPHANADCERIFSQINLIKTKTRNRLITETINQVFISSDNIKRNPKGCMGFQPSKNMVNSMTSRTLYGKSSHATSTTTGSVQSNTEIDEDDIEFFMPL